MTGSVPLGGRDRAPRTSAQRGFAFALMVIAGWCDAAGFMLFSQLYVSFMSGDATQFGLKLGGGDWSAAGKLLAAQAVFVAGAGIGRFYRLARPRSGRRATLAAIVALLSGTAMFGALGLGTVALALALLAMGLQNAVMAQEAGVPVGTMITGTLVRLGESLADQAHGRPAAVGDNFGQWVFFVLGALGGVAAYRLLGAASFWPPAVFAAALIPIAARLPEMIEQPQGSLS